METDTRAIKQLVYASAATVPFSNEDLEQLLELSRKNNEQLDVSGVLLFRDNTFFQVLEGAPEVVTSLYEKIGLDARHDKVLLLADRTVDERNFGDWSMGYVRDAGVIDDLPGFVDFFTGRTFVDLYGDAARMRQILDGFRRGRWRRASSEPVAR